MWQFSAAAALAILAAALLVLRLRRAQQARAAGIERFFAAVQGYLLEQRFESTGAVGYPRLCGRYDGLNVQVQAVIDTLALRRLPVLWLLVTVQDALPVKAKLDLMMRPAGPTTFSNFDLLPHTLPLPVGFPEQAVLRTDDRGLVMSAEFLRPFIGMFADKRVKELLITPNGVRVVWMLAEADRLRYGVFRQAEFGAAALQPELLRSLLTQLLAIRQSILQRQVTRA